MIPIKSLCSWPLNEGPFYATPVKLHKHRSGLLPFIYRLNQQFFIPCVMRSAFFSFDIFVIHIHLKVGLEFQFFHYQLARFGKVNQPLY